MSYPEDCTVPFSTVVHHEGFDFEFTGKWVPFVKATTWSPAEGGYLNEYSIQFDGKPAEKILNDDSINTIISLAVAEKSRE